jgi:signal transduction histidine kinase
MPTATQPGAGRLLARRTVVLAVLYLAAGSAAALLQPPAVGSLFWPPAGIAVALLLVSPRRWWPVLLAAVGLVELSRNLLGGAPPAPSLLWASANVLTPLVASFLARHWATLEPARPRRVAAYLLAIVVGAGAGALVGAAGTVVVGASTPYPLLVATWLVGDALGVLIVSPFLLLVLGQFPDTRLTLRDALSVTATVVLAVAAVGVVMTSIPQLRLLYLLVLPMAWVATRWRLPGAALGVFVLANGLIAATWLGVGPFVTGGRTPLQVSVEMQLFLGVVSAGALWFAARAAELRNLEALAEDRARLLAAVSHELRTPLTSIVGFSEHLLEHSPTLSESDRIAIAAIDRNGRHLTRLIEELLQVRQTRRHVEARPEPVDLATLLPSLVADRPGADIEVELPPVPPTAWVDPGHVVQVVSNLLDNALRHGAPPVRVEVVEDRRQLRIRVVDQGPGVPVDYAPRLFEEFSQPATGDRRSSTGLGLGLAIARQLARANGGELRYLPLAAGACFELTIPRAAEAAQDERVGAAGARA